MSVTLRQIEEAFETGRCPLCDGQIYHTAEWWSPIVPAGDVQAAKLVCLNYCPSKGLLSTTSSQRGET